MRYVSLTLDFAKISASASDFPMTRSARLPEGAKLESKFLTFFSGYFSILCSILLLNFGDASPPENLNQITATPLPDTMIEAFFARASRSAIEHDDLIGQVTYCLGIGRPFEAYRAWRLWCGQHPADSYGWMNAAAVAANAGFREEAILCALELFKIAPDNRETVLWALSMILISSSFTNSLDQKNINLISESYTKRLREEAQLQQIQNFFVSQRTDQKKKYRIGYFWNYFDVGSEFCFPFHHNRDRFEIVAVQPASQSSPRDRIGADYCIDYPTDDLLGAVRMIRAGDLDLLIDLNGRGDNNFADLILEARVAPVQAIYGNFHASTFSPSIDALIGDQAILEIIAADRHSERLVALSQTCMAVRNPHANNHQTKYNVSARRYKYRIGTPGNHLKLSTHFLKFVAKIIIKIPDSTFFYCHYGSEETSEYIIYLLTSEGAPLDRIEIFNQYQVDYYSMINEIDVAIDSLPYNGHLSTYEFLSEGAPVWSVRGSRMTQQYGHMLIGHVGMNEWVFDSEEELIDSLARNIQVKTPEAAARLRQRVADSALGDPARATRLMEDAIETLIQQTR